MEIRFTFTEWLTILNPNCRIRITTENGHIYQSKDRNGLSFEMTLIGFDFKKMINN